jgi:hypothetical protein
LRIKIPQQKDDFPMRVGQHDILFLCDHLGNTLMPLRQVDQESLIISLGQVRHAFSTN